MNYFSLIFFTITSILSNLYMLKLECFFQYAATIAKVDHFIMVSSLGTNKVGFPAAILK